MKYPSLHVASHIANICHNDGIEFNNTKIQKLMYCCYGCVLAVYNSARICDEYPRAWTYGPVFPRVFSYINKKKDILVIGNLNAPDDILKLLTDVVAAFGKYTANSLSAWTHKKGSPWDIVVNDMDAPNSIIPDDLILEYFKQNVVVMDKNA
ncbi:MAG: DUF4065 domain-containing protein [Synergistaceae bacterium]|jgi:uncharacterized phage-associated protein|nr:DUF4065 domain-containing protein [Synergistaceae bacterium]